MNEDKESLRFGTIAIKLGFTTLERVDECMRLQEQVRQMGVPPQKLGELMMAKGYLTDFQVKEVFRYQGERGRHTQISGYKILGKIGSGAMGAVYKALQISMDRTVAIKVLAPRFARNEKFRDRFLREARAVARLNHPNIIQGIDVGESNGIYYFSMEFIDGPSVGDLLKRGGALDEKRAMNIVLQIARALDHAFTHGIIHRDIKPDNILLTREGSAKLCDLGLAKRRSGADPKETNPGAAMGTPYYIAPEQARGEETVDTRSDLYSLGASFYHMVTGVPPFEAESSAEVIAKHLNEDPIPPVERNPLVSAAVNNVILKALQKNPDDRYATPVSLVKDLEIVVAGGMPEAFRASRLLRARPTPPRLRSRILRSRRRFHHG